MILKRVLPSRQDEKTMTVGFRSGDNREYFDYKLPTEGNRHRSYKLDECERVVFNAIGEGVCLNTVAGSIVSIQLTQKFGNRLVSSCYDNGSGFTRCKGKYGKKMFSSKDYDINTKVLNLQKIQ